MATVLTIGLTIFDTQHNHILQDYVAREDDLVILSATLFKNSSFYKPNTAVLLLNAHQVFHLKHPNLLLISRNETSMMKIPFKVEQVVGQTPFYCKWVPYLATGQVVDGANSIQIQNTFGDELEVGLRLPYTRKHDVVVCFTPLFLNEKWQLLLLSSEIYSHYGAFMQFYVRSMLTDLFQLLSLYRNVRITAWPRVRLGKHRASAQEFDPNIELEFRNQASAMTDCLLRYKASAKYIIFPDPDDVIIPRLDRKGYFQEFQQIFAYFPNAAAIAYNMSQAELTSGDSPDTFSLSSTLKSISFKGEIRWGKLVVKPSLVNSVWIHSSYGIKNGYSQYSLPVHNNSVIHLRYWTHLNKIKNIEKIPKYDPLLLKNQTVPILEQGDINEIEKSFAEKMKFRMDLYHNMPSTMLYYPLIEKCYNKIFYNGERHGTCKGPELCNIPRFTGVRCINVVETYESLSSFNSIYVHYLQNFKFEQSLDGCRL